jgi:hypothetical protein
MRITLFSLLCLFVFSCSQPIEKEMDPSQLSCEKAVNLFQEIAKEADRSCQKDDDCVLLGSHGNCDCMQFASPGSFTKPATQLHRLHERIFLSSQNCTHEKELLPCLMDGSRGPDYYQPSCVNGICSSISQGEDLCGPWNNP